MNASFSEGGTVLSVGTLCPKRNSRNNSPQTFCEEKIVINGEIINTDSPNILHKNGNQQLLLKK